MQTCESPDLCPTPGNTDDRAQKTRYKTAENRVFLVVGNKTQDLLDPTGIQGLQKTVDKIMEEKFTKGY